MDPTLILIIVLTFAFAATRVEERLLGARSALIISLEYVLIGVLVGPYSLGLFGADALESLKPLLGVVTGFAGFLVGLPFNLRSVRQRARGTTRFAIVTTLGTAGAVGGLAWATFWFTDLVPGVAPEMLAIGATTLGLGATITSVESIRAGITAASADGPLSRLLPTAAQWMAVLAVLAFGLSLALQRSHATQLTAVGPLVWVGIAALSGVALGLIFHTFVGDERDEKKLFVATIGVVALASGLAHALSFSPLFVNMVCGATIATTSRVTPALIATDIRLRRPVFALLLLLAGASWRPIPVGLWLVPLGFIAARVVALRFSARLAILITGTDVDTSLPRVGNGLLAQGALVAAVAVDYWAVSDAPVLGGLVLTTLLLSAVVNEMWAAPALGRVIRNAGEGGRVAAPRPQPAAPSLALAADPAPAEPTGASDDAGVAA